MIWKLFQDQILKSAVEIRIFEEAVVYDTWFRRQMPEKQRDVEKQKADNRVLELKKDNQSKRDEMSVWNEKEVGAASGYYPHRSAGYDEAYHSFFWAHW